MGVAQQKQDRRLEVFEDLYTMWTERSLTQAQAAAALGVCDRTFRRWVERHREESAEEGGGRSLAGPPPGARLPPCGAGGRGDAHGGRVPHAVFWLERATLLHPVPAGRRRAQFTTGCG